MRRDPDWEARIGLALFFLFAVSIGLLLGYYLPFRFLPLR